MKKSIGEIFGRLVLFILCGGIVLLIYLVTMFPLAGMITEMVEASENADAAPPNITFLLYTLFYIVPLFILIFARDVGLKVQVLNLTGAEAGGFNLRRVFREVYRTQGIMDFLIYAVYSLVMLIPFGSDPFENPFVFITIQESFFYTLSLPRIIGWFLSVACFALQYALCLMLISFWWNKKRIRQ